MKLYIARDRHKRSRDFVCLWKTQPLFDKRSGMYTSDWEEGFLIPVEYMKILSPEHIPEPGEVVTILFSKGRVVG